MTFGAKSHGGGFVGISTIPICPGQLINNWPQGLSSRVQRVKTVHVIEQSSGTNYVWSAREEQREKTLTMIYSLPKKLT
jgi:hypothetical protein